MHFCRTSLQTLSVALIGCSLLSAACGDERPEPEQTSRRVKRLIELLDSDNFDTQQRAFKDLLNLELAAAELVMQTYLGEKPNVEVRARCAALLQNWSDSDDDKFVAELEKMVDAIGRTDPPPALDKLARLREVVGVPQSEEVAIQRLTALGCEFNATRPRTTISFHRWHGEPSHLRYLRAIKEPFDVKVDIVRAKQVVPSLGKTNLAALTIGRAENKVPASLAAEDLRGLPKCRRLRSITFSMINIEPKCYEVVGQCALLTDLQLPPGTTDESLQHIDGLKKLQKLKLQNSFGVHGPGLVHLRELKQLEQLEIFYTKVDTASLKHLVGLPKLKYLYLPQTTMFDAGMKHVAQMKQLEHLKLDNTQVTNRGLALLSNLDKLDHLELISGSFSDAGLRPLSNIQSLTSIHVGGSLITEKGQHRLKALNRSIRVRGSFFEPTSAKQYESLERLLAYGMRVQQYPKPTQLTLDLEAATWTGQEEDVLQVANIAGARLRLIGPFPESMLASVLKLPPETTVSVHDGQGDMSKFKAGQIDQLRARFSSLSDQTAK